MTLLTTKEAAKVLGVSPARVRHLIKEGRMASVKHGRDHLIEEAEVQRFKQHGWLSGRKGGRPSKSES